MIAIRHDPPVTIGGQTISVVCRVKISGVKIAGTLTFSAIKQPVAVICEDDQGATAYSATGEPISPAALDAIIAGAFD